MRYLSWLIAVLLSILSLAAFAEPYYFEVLEKTPYAWNGQVLEYPKTEDQTLIVSGVIYIEKNQSLPWHSMNVPMMGYIKKGSVILEDEFKNIHIVSEGQTFVNGPNIVQRSHAGGQGVEILVFCLGDPHEIPASFQK